MARIGRPGSLVWSWLSGFQESYLPRLVERGLLTEEARAEWVLEWERASRAPETRLVAPTVVEAILRKPAAVRP